MSESKGNKNVAMRMRSASEAAFENAAAYPSTHPDAKAWTRIGAAVAATAVLMVMAGMEAWR